VSEYELNLTAFGDSNAAAQLQYSESLGGSNSQLLRIVHNAKLLWISFLKPYRSSSTETVTPGIVHYYCQGFPDLHSDQPLTYPIGPWLKPGMNESSNIHLYIYVHRL
jgi:hypothetical protein